ncbi:MAG: hypothetical protein ABJF04_21730 [Reichenbachiella sp.]|uniref:hypothetical protein n=1 Tax=Reichenbachiella sp. TaxID=2184521 RepID=UPI003266870E
MDAWYLNPYFLAFYGLLAYIIIEWSLTKDRYDRRHDKFNFSQYAREKYDNWIVCFILTPIIVWFGPDLLKAIGQIFGWKMRWMDAMYLGVGALVHVMGYAVKRMNLVMRQRV